MQASRRLQVPRLIRLQRQHPAIEEAGLDCAVRTQKNISI